MKLLRIVRSLDPRGGGPVEGIRRIDQELNSLGHQTAVLCLDKPDENYLTTYCGAVHAIGKGVGKYGFNSKLGSWLKANVRDFDCVIVNGIWQYHSIGARRALLDAGVPYFVFTHGMLDPWFKARYPLKHFKKSIYWRFFEHKVLRDAAGVVFTSDEERLLAKDSFRPYMVNEFVTSYGTSGPPVELNVNEEPFFRTFPQCVGKRVLLFLSRIHEKKGCDLLIQAFSLFAKEDRSLHLVMAGPDQHGWVEHLKDMASRLGVADQITWAGMLQGELKWSAYYASEVFILPSHQENFGIVVAEALSCGKSVLISNKVNIWREIESDGAGFVAEDTVEGTVLNIRRWLSLEGAERLDYSARARLSFERRYAIRSAANRLAEIVQSAGVSV